jgi:hypothetical protein
MLQSERFEETGFSFSTAVPEPRERRRQERHLTILRVGALVIGGRRELCLIRNISAGGLMAHVYSALETGTQVAVELKTNQQVAGRIVWVQDSNAGIAFDCPIDVAELLSNPPVLENGWRPRMPRVEVDKAATLRCGAQTAWVTVRDISQGGARITSETVLEEGADIVLTPSGFRPIAGVVRWRGEGCCGIAFNGPLPFGELMAWLKQGA